MFENKILPYQYKILYVEEEKNSGDDSEKSMDVNQKFI